MAQKKPLNKQADQLITHKFTHCNALIGDWRNLQPNSSEMLW